MALRRTIISEENSKTAQKLEKTKFKFLVNQVTVSKRTPGRNKESRGWKEVLVGNLENVGNPYVYTDVWIKTATNGGRRRVWVKYAQ